MFRTALITVLTLLHWFSYGQEYQVTQYRVENGLPSDVIKATAQDSLSYLWIATDDGLAKYDGFKFSTYRSALHSPYSKGLLKTKSGRLLAYGDLDLLEIQNQSDTVTFSPLRQGGRNPGDSTLWYPKSLFEDSDQHLWLGEPQSVVCMRGDQMERYDFPLEERSPQFLRSFSFFEDRLGHLYCVSIRGKVFVFDKESNQFRSVTTDFPEEVEHVSIANNQVWIGARDGLFLAHLNSDGGFSAPVLRFATMRVSTVTYWDGRAFIGTRGQQHFLLDTTSWQVSHTFAEMSNINHASISSEDDLWLAASNGLFLVQDNLIQRVSSADIGFIESVVENPLAKEFFYATMTDLYSVSVDQSASPHTKLLLSIPSGYFQSLQFVNGGLWAANGYSLLLLRNGTIQQRINLSREGRFITDIFVDRDHQLWLGQAGNNYGVVVDSLFQIKRVRVPIEKEGTINLFRQGPTGMYAASTGTSAYLFFKADQDTIFQNISLPVTFPTQGDFNVSDMAISDRIIWLATSEGLLKYDYQTIARVPMEERYYGLPVKNVKPYGKDHLLFANAFGLVLYNLNTAECSLFNESTGLASNTITTRGLFVDQQDRIWIGTSRGLCYTRAPLRQKTVTPQPVFVNVDANGVPVRFTQQTDLAYGSFVTISISSLTFPEKEIVYQYRILPKQTWESLKGSTLSLPVTRAGRYQIEVRSKKTGLFEWSHPSSLTISIGKPFWQQNWFILLGVVFVTLIALASTGWANQQNKKRRQELEHLIDERTNELRVINEELSLRNKELDRFVYSASHDLSAPLKSILGLISVAKLEKPVEPMSQYLNMMERSVIKLDSFIRDIITYSRNARLPVKKDPVDFEALIQSVWSDHQFSPAASTIDFKLDFQLSGTYYSDEMRWKIIFNNLLSNAIKFSQPNIRAQAFIKVSAFEKGDDVVFSVEDNGMGISNAFQKHIFEMFYRATESVPGSGLGLYILKETLTRLGGIVNVASELGVGTTFTITCPRSNFVLESLAEVGSQT